MLVTEIDKHSWKKALHLSELPVFFQPDYLDAVADSFNVRVRYFVVGKTGTPKAAIAIFVKRNRVICPENFTYTPLWLNHNLDEREGLQVLQQLVQHFKKLFSKITLRLGVEFSDMRPFIWEGFGVENRYTYIKNPLEPVHYSISKNLKHQAIRNYKCTVHDADEESIKLNIDFLKRLGYSKRKSNGYESLFSFFNKLGLLKAFSLHKDGAHLGSSLVLIDQPLSKAYMLVSNPIDRTEKYAHTFLYRFTIDSLAEQGIKEIDLCGANMESIAYFKSYFNPQLKPYFIVRYSNFRDKFGLLLRLLEGYS